MGLRQSSWTMAGSVALAALTLLACKQEKQAATLASSTATAAPTPTPTARKMKKKIYKVGETAKAHDYTLTVSAVRPCKNKYYFSKPKKGWIWLGTEVSIQSLAKKPFFANPGSAQLIDGDGIAHNPTFQVTKDCNPPLSSTELAKGEKAKGWIVFEVAEDSKNLKLSYNPSIFGAAQTTKFDLGR